MTLVRWSPVGELASMEIDRLNRMFFEAYIRRMLAFWYAFLDAPDRYLRDRHSRAGVQGRATGREAGRHQHDR